MTDYIQFNLDGFHNRTLDAWREVISRHDGIVERSNWRRTAFDHALKHGAAGVWRADDSLLLFYRDGSKVRQKTFPKACPIQLRAA